MADTGGGGGASSGGGIAAFGEAVVAENTPAAQVQFPYNVNPEIVDIRINGGTCSSDNSRLKLSTGAGANQSAQVLTRIPVKYQPGQGGRIRFTAVFTIGVAGSTQLIGVGDVADGYYFGFQGADFGYTRRVGGSQEMQTMTVTTGSSHAENITITLDGDAETTVAVTNTADTTLTANEIAAHDYSNVGVGWFTKAAGSVVEFVSFDAAPHSGTFTLSGATSAVGVFAQDVGGIVPTEFVTNQPSWNRDVADGTQRLQTLTTDKGNVYDIKYKWLGHGAQVGSIERAVTGRLLEVHVEQCAGTSTAVSVNNPTLPLCAIVKNTSNTSDLVMFVGSMAGFIEGRLDRQGIRRGAFKAETSVGTTEIPLLTIHNRLVYNGKINRVRARLSLISVTNDGTKSGVVKIYRDVTLTGANFVNLNTANSVLSVDVSATALDTVTGSFQFPIGLAKSATEVVDVDALDMFINPGEFITLSGLATLPDALITVGANVSQLF